MSGNSASQIPQAVATTAVEIAVAESATRRHVSIPTKIEHEHRLHEKQAVRTDY